MDIIYSDDELIYLFRQGNNTATDLLVERYTVFFNKWLANYNFSYFDRQDCLQRCWIVFFNALEEYDNTIANFYSFMQKVIINTANSFYRKKHEERTNIYYELSEEGKENEFSTNDFPESRPLMLEDVLKLGVLNELETSLITLKAYGFSYNYIANELDISIKTVDNTYQSIRRKLNKAKKEGLI